MQSPQRSEKAIRRTIKLAKQIQSKIGVRAVPHISARQIVSGAHLDQVVDWLAPFEECFVVSGDCERAGPFDSSTQVITLLKQERRLSINIGVAGYPEDSSSSSMDKLLGKQQAGASFVCSQICFDVGAVTGWAQRCREAGVRLPLFPSVVGKIEWKRLAEIMSSIGLYASFSKVSPELLWGHAQITQQLVDDPTRSFAGVHVCTFNNVVDAIKLVSAARARA